MADVVACTSTSERTERVSDRADALDGTRDAAHRAGQSERIEDAVGADTLSRLQRRLSGGGRVLLLMRGAPGSGKTTLARYLLQSHALRPPRTELANWSFHLGNVARFLLIVDTQNS